MEISRKSHIKDIKLKAKGFMSDRKNANHLLDVIGYLQSEDETAVLITLRSLSRIFPALISSQQMYMNKVPTEKIDLEDLVLEEKYQMWLRERYADTREALLELLGHESNSIQELALCTLMKFVEAEGHTPLTKMDKSHLQFPVNLFRQILLSLLDNNTQRVPLIKRFQEFLEYDDVRYFTMKMVLTHLKVADNCSDDYLLNTFTLMENLSMPQLAPDEDKMTNFLSKIPDTETTLKISTYKEYRKVFTSLWLEFLRKKLTASVYKKVLVALPDKVMPHMTNALFLSDFLTTSYNIGGAISLMALNGLFILVNSFNLDYPDFYRKLYLLLEPSVFHVKYRSRFLFLADLFLTSTHLPAYLVAAFVKRLARLALTAPPDGLAVIIPFIYNLINRHPNCKILLHHPDGPKDVEEDPYDIEEQDPAKCRALESSLWELKSLENHYQHTVSSEASKVKHPLQPGEIDVSDLLDISTDILFKREIKKKMKTIPTTFEAPEGLFGSRNDHLKDFWVLA